MIGRSTPGREARRRVSWGIVIAAFLLLTSCPSSPPARKGVILVVLDTTRADHLSCMGYSRPTSPNMDRLAEESRLYRNAWSQAPWTLPSFASIVSGQLPRHHGAGRAPDGRLFPIAEDVPTMAEHLGEAGWQTAAWVNVVFCNPRSGVARGFTTYDFQSSDASNTGHRDARATTDAALAWAEAADPDAPFLMMVHYFDPHLTYDPPPPFDTRFEPDEQEHLPTGFGSASQLFAMRSGELKLTPRQTTSLIARYDGEIAFTDEQFARLRSGLEQLGMWDESLVIVVADHGEEFWDHGGFEHGHSHYRELLHVPLIVKRPGEPAGTRDELVRQIDILPTVLDYAGLAVPPELPGQVLGSAGVAYSVAEGSLWAGELISIRGAEGTLIQLQDGGSVTFFAAEDDAESLSVPAGTSPDARALIDALQALPPLGSLQEPWQPTEEELQRIRALGYAG